MPRERERERPDNINLRLQLDRTDLVVSTVTVCVCVCRSAGCVGEQRETSSAGRETNQLGEVGPSRREHCMGQGHS